MADRNSERLGVRPRLSVSGGGATASAPLFRGAISTCRRRGDSARHCLQAPTATPGGHRKVGFQGDPGVHSGDSTAATRSESRGRGGPVVSRASTPSDRTAADCAKPRLGQLQNYSRHGRASATPRNPTLTWTPEAVVGDRRRRPAATQSGVSLFLQLGRQVAGAELPSTRPGHRAATLGRPVWRSSPTSSRAHGLQALVNPPRSSEASRR